MILERLPASLMRLQMRSLLNQRWYSGTTPCPQTGIGGVAKSVRRTRSCRIKFCVQRGLGALPSTSKFVAVDSHKHCLRQYASLKNVVFDNYAQTAFYRYDYANKGLNFILVSDKMILTNGGVSLERSGRKIAVFAGKCQAVPG